MPGSPLIEVSSKIGKQSFYPSGSLHTWFTRNLNDLGVKEHFGLLMFLRLLLDEVPRLRDNSLQSALGSFHFCSDYGYDWMFAGAGNDKVSLVLLINHDLIPHDIFQVYANCRVETVFLISFPKN